MQNPRTPKIFYKINHTLKRKFANVINNKVKKFLNYKKKDNLSLI